MEELIKKTKTFSWDLHYRCNYRCPYCWFHGKWVEKEKENVYPELKDVLNIWKSIYEQYGEGSINILGGEPLIYPKFDDMIKELSYMYMINITSNLSVNIENILKYTSPSRVSINGSFHPSFANLDDFINKVTLLKKEGRRGGVSYVAYPSQIELIPYYRSKFLERGMDLTVMTFWGEYNGKKYPESYSEKEKKFLKPYLGETKGEKYQLEPRQVKGELCLAGHLSASIKANGDACACGGNAPRMLGNIFKGDFKLLDGPALCESDFCPCNEWVYYQLEEEIEHTTIKDDPGENIKLNLSRGYILEESAKPVVIKHREIAVDRSNISPYRVFYTWDIHYACNYRCSYCNTPKPNDQPSSWDKDRMKIVYPPFDTLNSIWEDIYNRYGTGEIQITGGEPFIYPNFFELIKKLSKIYTLEVFTNLSFDADKLIKTIASDRLRIGSSFHPSFADINKFTNKIRLLKKHGFEVWVNYVAYPPILKEMFDYKVQINDAGASFNIQPYMGVYENRKYPSDYRESELSYFKKCYNDEDIVNKKTIEWKTEAKQRKMKGKLCRMGQMYAKIFPVGDVYRCCGNGSSKLGNIFDGTFELLNDAMPCECEHCFCWRCMLEDEEKNWGQHWVVPQKQIVSS